MGSGKGEYFGCIEYGIRGPTFRNRFRGKSLFVNIHDGNNSPV